MDWRLTELPPAEELEEGSRVLFVPEGPATTPWVVRRRFAFRNSDPVSDTGGGRLVPCAWALTWYAKFEEP